MSRYVVHFERIGRRRDLGLFAIDADSAEELEAGIGRHAQKYLLSTEFDVQVNLTEGRGSIEGGRFGRFTFVEGSKG